MMSETSSVTIPAAHPSQIPSAQAADRHDFFVIDGVEYRLMPAVQIKRTPPASQEAPQTQIQNAVDQSLSQASAVGRSISTGWKSAIDYSRMVTILAGADKIAFVVHETLLKSKSEYFRKALDGNWQESVDKTFELKDEKPTVVGLFVDWLYTKNIDIVREAETDSFLVEAYQFAERRGALECQNAIIDKLDEIMDATWYPSMDLVSVVYSEALPMSKLCQYFVDKWVWDGPHQCPEAYEPILSVIPPMFFSALLQGMSNRLRAIAKPMAKCVNDADEHICRFCKISIIPTAMVFLPLCTRKDAYHICQCCDATIYNADHSAWIKSASAAPYKGGLEAYHHDVPRE